MADPFAELLNPQPAQNPTKEGEPTMSDTDPQRATTTVEYQPPPAYVRPPVPIKPFRVVRARTIAAAIVVAFGLLAIGAAGGVVWEKHAAPTTTPFAVPMGQRDIACVQVLRNGGVPEDCSRMYHLDFYP